MAKRKSVSEVRETFLITSKGEKASELIRQGGYDWHNDWITDERFPIKPHAPVTRTIEFVEFDHDPTSKEVLAEYQRHGLSRPTYEDAFYFGIQHKEEQRKAPIVFLHKPVLSPSGNHDVLVLDGNTGVRDLHLIWFDDRWYRNYRFAGVRES